MIVIIQNLDEWKNLLQSNAFVVQGECLKFSSLMHAYYPNNFIQIFEFDTFRSNKKKIDFEQSIWNLKFWAQRAETYFLGWVVKSKKLKYFDFLMCIFYILHWKWGYFSSRLWMFVSSLVVFSISYNDYHFHPISILLYWNCHKVCW